MKFWYIKKYLKKKKKTLILFLLRKIKMTLMISVELVLIFYLKIS